MKSNSKMTNDQKSKLKKHSKLINFSVLTGFIFLLIWIFFFYQKTFIDIKIVLGMLFLPSLVVTILFYRKIVPVNLGSSLLNYISYVVVYFLVTIPIGNLLIVLFFSINTLLASDTTEKVKLKTENVGLTKSKRRTLDKNKYYSHYEVTYEGITKRFKTGNTPIDDLENKMVEFKLAKGFLGYYVIKGRKIQ